MLVHCPQEALTALRNEKRNPWQQRNPGLSCPCEVENGAQAPSLPPRGYQTNLISSDISPGVPSGKEGGSIKKGRGKNPSH